MKIQFAVYVEEVEGFLKKTYFIYMKKINPLKLIIFAAIICCAVYFAFDFLSENKDEVSYQEFLNLTEENKITSVQFFDDKLVFTLKADGNEKPQKKSTQNPQSPSLRESLLLKGITVSDGANTDEIISTAFDVVFYLFFFGIIVIAFRKFISPNTFKTVHRTGVTFDDVIGMDKLKKDMSQIAEIMKNPEKYKKQGVRMPKGILLEGAPGNGKTLFARALAGEAKVNFIPTKATDFESMFMAIGPLKVKLLFSKARRKAPCIVFIDEFDGIGTKRNYSGSAIETENTRIVTALLNELDGFTKNEGILVLAATNSIAALDEALIRPGRFDARYSVPYPDADTREKLSEFYLRGKKYDSEVTPQSLSKLFSGFSSAKIESVLNNAVLTASQNERDAFTLEDVKAAAAALKNV